MRLRLRLRLRAAKHLVPRRAQVPLAVRVPLMLALPAMMLPGVPDLGWDEFWLAVAAAMLLIPSVRRRTQAVWQDCMRTARAEQEGRYCAWCSERWERKQARRARWSARLEEWGF